MVKVLNGHVLIRPLNPSEIKVGMTIMDNCPYEDPGNQPVTVTRVYRYHLWGTCPTYEGVCRFDTTNWWLCVTDDDECCEWCGQQHEGDC